MVNPESFALGSVDEVNAVDGHAGLSMRGFIALLRALRSSGGSRGRLFMSLMLLSRGLGLFVLISCIRLITDDEVGCKPIWVLVSMGVSNTGISTYSSAFHFLLFTVVAPTVSTVSPAKQMVQY